MYHNRFTIQIDLFKYKRFKDVECAYKNTGSSHLKRFETENAKQWAFCISWSRDQLSVNTKTVRFWKILLARAVGAY